MGRLYLLSGWTIEPMPCPGRGHARSKQLFGWENLRSLTIGFWALILSCALAAGTFVAAPPAPARIVLPVELIAGEPATLAVLTSDGHIAPAVKIVLSDGQVLTTDESGRAHFLVPLQTGPLFVRIIGSEIREVADILPRQSATGDLQSVHAPAIASLGDCVAITGSGFDGDADRNNVEINGYRTFVLASSPTQLILMPPPNITPGPASLSIKKGSSEVAANLTFVSVTPVNPSAMQIRHGKQEVITLLVRGTAQPVNLEIHNLTPHVAQISHRDALLIRSTGGTENSTVIRIKGLAVGQFSYSVSIKGTSIGAGWQFARDFLQAARKMANPADERTIESILKKLQQKHVEINSLQRELRSIAASSEPSDFETLLYAAERSLGGY